MLFVKIKCSNENVMTEKNKWPPAALKWAGGAKNLQVWGKIWELECGKYMQKRNKSLRKIEKDKSGCVLYLKR